MNYWHLPVRIYRMDDVETITIDMGEGGDVKHFNWYTSGVELHLQDEGRTLKITPRKETSDD